MSATGLDVFDKTLQTTNIWLDEVMADVGPDRQVAWHVLGAVLRALRDRIPADLAAHLGAQLPLLVRGSYYDGYRPSQPADRSRDQDAFLGNVNERLADTRPVNARDAVTSVFGVLSAHLPRGQCERVRDALPADIKVLWHLDEARQTSREDKAGTGRAAQHAQEARRFRARHGAAANDGGSRE
ncbi:MAG: DUF2267 domain-containing protein [Reyranella sp.]